jgi:hypothetical protein
MRFDTSRSTSDKAARAARSSGFSWLIRAGFVARGLVYGVIGGLALALALGAAGGSTTNQQGALALIAGAPLGSVALAVLAVGILAYAVWQIGQAALGRGLESAGRDSKTDRLANLGSGLAYVGLFVIAVKVLFEASSDQSSGPRKAAAGVLGWPGGQWIVGVGGLAFVVVCFFMAYDGVSGNYLENSKTEQMSAKGRRAFGVVGRVGRLARAVVFALVGYFLIRTAIDFNPNKAIGVDGALRKVAQEPYGSWLLAIVAIGLIAFAVSSVAEARYERL